MTDEDRRKGMATSRSKKKVAAVPEIHDPLYDLEEGKKKAAAAPPPDSASSTGVDLPDDDMIEMASTETETERSDTFRSAVKMAFIGAGQGGGRIAQSFYDLGYRRVCAVNTTDQDLKPLSMPAKLVIGDDRGGAGKDPEQGKLAAEESFEEIMDLLMRAWGEGVENCYICVGAGGGSGTGSWPTLVKAVQEYCKSTNVEKPLFKHLGVIMSIPKRSEGARVQRNASEALSKAVQMVESKKISSLIMVDNAKIHELFPRLPVKRFWQVANRNFAAVLHTFNLLAAQDSEYNTFDRADFRSVLRSGLMIFGMTRVAKWSRKEDISQAVRQNLKNSLLADGFDLTTADMAGAIVVAHDTILEEIPMENIDYAFNSLGRALGNENITLHNGIYEGRQTGMRVFTIISGLDAPAGRLQELEQLAQ
jgi:cell division GTPase FtsZ